MDSPATTSSTAIGNWNPVLIWLCSCISSLLSYYLRMFLLYSIPSFSHLFSAVPRSQSLMLTVPCSQSLMLAYHLQWQESPSTHHAKSKNSSYSGAKEEKFLLLKSRKTTQKDLSTSVTIAWMVLPKIRTHRNEMGK